MFVIVENNDISKNEKFILLHILNWLVKGKKPQTNKNKACPLYMNLLALL